ncbi:pheromone processing endoprotease [Basidiobolus ranarum]|uniref:Pheromone processing endoprotease n=1 Tax=Basidiobolus ranarum TaxID=34480 RepID=A0ABR2W9V8_9FUNG
MASESDPVNEHISMLQEHRMAGRLEKRSLTALNSIYSLEKQIPRLRNKRGPLPPPLISTQPDSQEYPNATTVAKTLNLEDPGFYNQWFLHNDAIPRNDINVTGVWAQGITGKGVVVAILDDGLDMDNQDLTNNYFAEGSFDFNDHVSQPKPRLSDDYHGTRCAGEIAAAKNDLCGIGVAYEAQVAGIRILSAEITDTDEALAINYQYQKNHVYSCSWGPPDDGKSMDGPSGVILYALMNGIQKGRGGKGSIYVFASGNGGSNDDNCNFDGYTNSIYTVTIGAIDRTNSHPFYSEICAAQLAVSYSSGQGSFIYTTDVGQKSCTSAHGGTSAAAPLAAGMVALALSIRPDLHWRDIQHLCVRAAVPISLEDKDWKPTAVGRLFNHKFGYGKLDAYQLVEAAKTHQLVGPQIRMETPVQVVEKTIPQDSTGINSTIVITDSEISKYELNFLEHITVQVNIAHERRGDLEVYLISPNQVVSQLAARRRRDESTRGITDWTFMDESPVGNWTLQVIDRIHPQKGGTFLNWSIIMFGIKSNPNLVVRSKATQATPTGHSSKKTQADAQEQLTLTISEESSIDSSWYLALSIFAVMGVLTIGYFVARNYRGKNLYRVIAIENHEENSSPEPQFINESTDPLLEES